MTKVTPIWYTHPVNGQQVVIAERIVHLEKVNTDRYGESTAIHLDTGAELLSSESMKTLASRIELETRKDTPDVIRND